MTSPETPAERAQRQHRADMDPERVIARARQLQAELNKMGAGVQTCGVVVRKTGLTCAEPVVAGGRCRFHGGDHIVSRNQARNGSRIVGFVPDETHDLHHLSGAELDEIIGRPKEDSERVTADILVGFGGYYECGKDAAGDELVAHHDFEKRYFSEPLHEWLLVQNPWIKLDVAVTSLEGWISEPGEFVKYAWLDYHVGYVEMKRQREVRDLLQKTGTNAGRRLIDEDIWANRMYVLTQKRIEELRASTRLRGEREITEVRIVITGVRYPNELEAIRKLGGTAIWIERPSATAAHEKRLEEDSERVTQGLEPLVHESDLMLTAEDFDLTIMNDGELKDLYARVAEWVKAPHPH